MTIHKYPIKVDEFQDIVHLELPIGAKPISVIMPNDKEVWLYAIVNPRVQKTTRRQIRIAGTGHPLNDSGPCDKHNFLGTIHFRLHGASHGALLVFHFFDLGDG